jgi:hypothetical protein
VSERPQNKHLKRGGSLGRKKGVLNKRTIEIREFARGVLEDPEYRAQLKSRLLKGTSPAIEQLLYYYAYGKPIDRIQLVGPVAQEVHRLAELYGMTAEEVLAEAEAIAQGRDV